MSTIAPRRRSLRTLLGTPAIEPSAFDDIQDIQARRALAEILVSHPVLAADLANTIRSLQAKAMPKPDTAPPSGRGDLT